MSSIEDLEVWKRTRELRKKISILTKSFPIEEKYKLTDQLLRASRSCTANLAEGYGRFHFQESIQYCRQARGSLYETIDHITCAFDEAYIDKEILKDLKNEIYNCIKILNGYIQYLKNKKENY
ncbi:MAG: four helix bundle protein [Bacteroidales bacterium]|jgi:four helix bundle protein|nr:four helix bundle protein [Bacteroidales bacterium]